MKNTYLATLMAFIALSPALLRAEDAIEDAMKKYHKGDSALCKKVGAGQASAAELGDILKAYEAMAKESPPKGDAASWKTKCDALIKSVTELKNGNAAAAADYKKAVACKACHEVHKGK